MTFVNRGVYKLKIMDFSEETAETSIFTPQLTVGNIVAQNALNAAYLAALEDLVGGVVVQIDTTANNSVDDAQNPPTDSTAQVELNWMIIYRDNVTLTNYTYRIACPLMDAALRQANEDFADLTEARWLAFKAAFEAAARSPVGNAVTLRNAVLVGKDA